MCHFQDQDGQFAKTTAFLEKVTTYSWSTYFLLHCVKYEKNPEFFWHLEIEHCLEMGLALSTVLGGGVDHTNALKIVLNIFKISILDIGHFQESKISSYCLPLPISLGTGIRAKR